MTKSISSEAFEKNQKKLDFCGIVSHLRESTISDLEYPSNFQVKEEEKYGNRSRNNEIMLILKMPKNI